MALLPSAVPLKGGRTASLAQQMEFSKGASDVAKVKRYNSELSKRAHDAKLDAAVLWAQSSEETSRYTSVVLAKYGNYAGMKNKAGTDYIYFKTPEDAARAQVIQMCAYVYGECPKLLVKWKPLA